MKTSKQQLYILKKFLKKLNIIQIKFIKFNKHIQIAGNEWDVYSILRYS